jgi:hypothetical protein
MSCYFMLSEGGKSYRKLSSSTSISEQRPSGEQFREATVDPEDTPEILRVIVETRV